MDYHLQHPGLVSELFYDIQVFDDDVHSIGSFETANNGSITHGGNDDDDIYYNCHSNESVVQYETDRTIVPSSVILSAGNVPVTISDNEESDGNEDTDDDNDDYKSSTDCYNNLDDSSSTFQSFYQQEVLSANLVSDSDSASSSSDDDIDEDFVTANEFIGSCTSSSSLASNSYTTSTMFPSRNNVRTTNEGYNHSGCSVNNPNQQRVKIIGGVHNGKFGTFIKRTPQRILVQLDGPIACSRYLAPHNVEFVSTLLHDVVASYSHQSNHVVNTNMNTIPVVTRPNSIPNVSSQSTTLRVGCFVNIIGGTYCGKNGTITKLTPQRVVVQIPNDPQVHYLHVKNVMVVMNDIPSNITGLYDNASSHPEIRNIQRTESHRQHIDSSTTYDENIIPNPQYTTNARIRNINTIPNTRTYRRRCVNNAVPQSSSYRRPNQWDVSTLLHVESNSIQQNEVTDVSSSASNPYHQLHQFIGHRVDYIALLAPGQVSQNERTLAYALFGDRLRTFKIPLTKLSTNLRITSTESDGSTYELLSTKLLKRSKGSLRYFESLHVQVQYVLTKHSGHRDIQPIHLQTELQRYANFSQLTVEKVAARLELLQSTAHMHNKKPLILNDLSTSNFEEITEVAHEGCGFMPIGFVQNYLGSNAVGRRTFAIQVRIIAPKLGMFKGMLVEKPGIDRIQLPSSMKKVGPSVLTDADDTVHVLINGIFPSNDNVLLYPRIFRGESLPKSYHPTKISDMIVRLLKQWPISKNVIDQYVDQSYHTPNGLGMQHACLVGLSDPTNNIPAGTIYITGIAQTPIRHKLFVTRFPCTEAATDAHLLQVIHQKPASMSNSDWDWLSNLPFGGIIFGNPNPGDVPLPCKIANGDLDGDLYFVCWNEDILSHLSEVRPIGARSTSATNSTRNTLTPHTSVTEDWFHLGQEWMCDVQRLRQLNDLICKLYTLWKKGCDGSIGIENDNHTDFSQLEDYTYFGRAFKDAIDIGKHGGLVYLPFHLWELIPEPLHALLTTNTSL